MSKTWVAPPVEIGSADTPSRSMNSSAKLFSSKVAMRPPERCVATAFRPSAQSVTHATFVITSGRLTMLFSACASAMVTEGIPGPFPPHHTGIFAA